MFFSGTWRKMKSPSLTYRFLVFTTAVFYVCADPAEDPCESDTEVPNMEKRDEFNEVSKGLSLISDRFLKERWYRTKDARTLLDKPPGFQHCGTLFPIWRKEKKGGVSTMCLQTSEGTCHLSFKIETTYCDAEEIFKLKRSPVRSAAYCFGWPGGEKPPDFAEKPVLDTTLLNKEAFTSELEFQCKYSKHKEEVFYRTSWLIDGKKLIRTEPIKWAGEDTIKKHALTEEMLKEAGITAFGFEVRCSVRVSYELDKPESPPVWSETSFIGIKVEKTALVLKEGESEDISLQLTAPFGCGQQTDNDCVLNIEAYNIEDPEDCKQAALVSSFCGTTVKHSQWNQSATVKVFGKISPDYGSSSHTTKLKLRTETLVPSRLWSNCDLGVITIQLTKDTSKIEGKSCHATNDPHMKTFDGRRYEHQYEGTFIMYKHNTLPIEVQLKTSPCGAKAMCNCGLIVRAGRTVFEFNKCPGYTRYWTAEYTLCEDGGDVLQVKRRGTKYEVILPTGGKVDVSLGGTYLNVYIFPSVQDVENSAGLCGKLSGVCSDDFVMSDGTYSLDKTAKAGCETGSPVWVNLLTQFSNSWRIGEKDSLFNHLSHKDLSSWPKTSTFCSCPVKDIGPDEVLIEKVTCTATEGRDVCVKLPGFTDVRPSKCTIQERRKRRSVLGAENEHKRYRRESQAWPDGWTEETAKAHCEELFEKSKSIQVCGNVTGVQTNGSMENCVLDIWLTGTTDFGSFAVDTVRSKCLHEVVANPVLRNNASSSNDSFTSQSVFDVVVTQACSNDCSGSGECVEGDCICETHYGGDDCSVDLRLPPELAEVDNDGHCDISRGTCHVISIYGETFVENGTSCLVEDIKVRQVNTESGASEVTAASILSINHIQCNLTTNMDTTGSDDVEFVNAYRISVANSGDIYSKSVGVMVYDWTCIKGEINGADFSWTLEGQYCIYRGKCIPNKEKHPDNPCLVCDVTGPNDDTRKWKASSEASCNPENDFPVIPVVVGIVVAVIILVIIVAVVYILKKKRSRKMDIDNTDITVMKPLTSPSTAVES